MAGLQRCLDSLVDLGRPAVMDRPERVAAFMRRVYGSHIAGAYLLAADEGWNVDLLAFEFVQALDECIRIRTGETGVKAIAG